MSANVFGSKKFNPVPPDKGSFPLDHHGQCKEFFLKYMICINENNGQNALCRDQSKDYLKCRMEYGLMAKESWENLGFGDSDKG